METKFIFWATFKGKKVYTNQNRNFSFTENVKAEVEKIIKRGYPINKDRKESSKTEKVKLKSIDGTTTFKGLHNIYTEINL